MVVLYVILAVLVLLIAVVLLRTAAFHPKAEAFRTYAPVEFDREAAVTNLQRLIRCRQLHRCLQGGPGGIRKAHRPAAGIISPCL